MTKTVENPYPLGPRMPIYPMRGSTPPPPPRAERATKSQEVDLSGLKGFRLRFALKLRGGVTSNPCLRLPLRNGYLFLTKMSCNCWSEQSPTYNAEMLQEFRFET